MIKTDTGYRVKTIEYNDLQYVLSQDVQLILNDKDERIGKLVQAGKKLRKSLEKMQKLMEFVEDCAASHHETRYKYRAQVLLREMRKNE